MGNYTTLVKTICEQKSTTDSKIISDIINSAAPKIFEKYAIFDEKHRDELNFKILHHFYFCEIGYETVGLWVDRLNARMCEIMPEFNQLYATAALDFDIFNNVNVTETMAATDSENAQNATQTTQNTDVKNSQKVTAGSQTQSAEKIEYKGGEKVARTDSDNSKQTTDSVQTQSTDTTVSQTKNDKYSNTPQGNLSSVQNDTYLTDYRQIDDNTNTIGENSNKDKTTVDNSGTATSNQTTSFDNRVDNKSGSGSTTQTSDLSSVIKTTDNSTASNSLLKNGESQKTTKIVGKNNTLSNSELLLQYRKTIINIDSLIIDSLQDLFMLIY